MGTVRVVVRSLTVAVRIVVRSLNPMGIGRVLFGRTRKPSAGAVHSIIDSWLGAAASSVGYESGAQLMTVNRRGPRL